jgi:hypothetical protein
MENVSGKSFEKYPRDRPGYEKSSKNIWSS